MAEIARDNNSSTEARDEDKTRPGRTSLAIRSNKPLFTSRRIGGRRSTDDEDGSSPSLIKTAPRSGNWLTGGSGTGIKLGEAFQRIDENGNLLPKPATSAAPVSVNNVSLSRIPRSKAFAGSSASPPRRGERAHVSRPQGDGVAATPAPGESESESTNTRDGSPSPAVRNRRRWSRESGIDAAGMVEDATEDDFDKKMTRFAKDQERVNHVLASQKGLFSRADIGPRIAETTRTLARKTSASSLESEPPLRPPRTWGSRAKRQGDWMRRILSPDAPLELKEPGLSNQEAPGADVPLPSVENGSSVPEPTPPASRPASAQPISRSPEKSKMWDADIDFTAHSLQISTSPQLRVRSTKLDDVRQREMESLTARAVASSILDEIKERNSEERSGVESPSVIAKAPEQMVTNNGETQPNEEIHEKTILEEEGEHIQGTPITIFSAGTYRNASNHSSRERISNHDREASAGSSDHKREDSREILRRLSRAASSSPAPSQFQEKPARLSRKPSEERPKEPEVIKRDPLKGKSLEVDADSKRNSTASTPPKSDVDPEERITAEAKLFELQDNKSERNSIRAPSRSPSPDDTGKFDETPKPKPNPLSLPTPRVSGAYIETPAPTIRKPWTSRSVSDSYELVIEEDGDVSILERKPPSRNATESSASSDKGSKERTRSRSTSSRRKDRTVSELPASTQINPRPLKNSAHPPTVAEDLRQIQVEAQIEDSTLDDFDALLEADKATTADFLANNLISKPIIDLEYDEKGNPLSQAERERRLERLTLDRMNQHLKNTSSSIRDARQGIERLEHQVLSSSPPRAPKSHGSHEDDNTIYLKIPIPRLWITETSQTDTQAKTQTRQPSLLPWSRNWKFTWLGLILSIFLSWYIAESTMCEIYCHPIMSSKNTWHPSDPFFPWAIPTKLDQWTGKVASSLLGGVWEGVEEWLWNDGDTLSRGNGGRRVRRRPIAPGSARDWWGKNDGPVGIVMPPVKERGNGGGGSFYDDEIIG